jgi:hypothetical protein
VEDDGERKHEVEIGIPEEAVDPGFEMAAEEGEVVAEK